MTIEIRHLDDPDILVEINNAAVPDVNRLDRRKAEWLLEHSALAKVAIVDQQAVGVIVVLDDTAGLDSEYFRWFTERYQNFIYIDRVIVTESARRHGVSTRLYRAVDELARDRRQAIASEVYCEPPNLPSLSFHEKMGYQPIGRQFCAAEAKSVAKLMKFGDYARPAH